MKMKKGFTLIELLAVIAILGIILTIAVPQVIKVIDNSEKSSFEISVKMLIKKVDLLLVENRLYDISTINSSNIKELFGVDDSNIKEVIVTKENDKTHIEIAGDNKWYGYFATGTFDNLSVYNLEFDNTPPVVVFETNGSASPVNSGGIVTVTDDQLLDNRSLKYLWTTSTTEPLEEDFSNSFDSGDEIMVTEGLYIGNYYLWILAKDQWGNVTIECSNVYLADSVKPIIEINGESVIELVVGQTYYEPGADVINEGDYIPVTITGTVNMMDKGIYTVTYTATDSAGNEAIPVIRTVKVGEQISVVYYTAGSSNRVISWTVPENITNINVVLVGAGGGSYYAGGGGGGLRWSDIEVTPGETLTFYIAGYSNFGQNGNDTTLKRGATTLLYAQGGRGAQGYTAGVGGGGSTLSSTVKGGNGGNGGIYNNSRGGGGGGAGGYLCSGGNGGPGYYAGQSPNPQCGSGGGGGGGLNSTLWGSSGGGVGLLGPGSSGSGGVSEQRGQPGSGGLFYNPSPTSFGVTLKAPGAGAGGNPSSSSYGSGSPGGASIRYIIYE